MYVQFLSWYFCPECDMSKRACAESGVFPERPAGFRLCDICESGEILWDVRAGEPYQTSNWESRATTGFAGHEVQDSFSCARRRNSSR